VGRAPAVPDEGTVLKVKRWLTRDAYG
jgi:hypothetical protein